MYHEFYKFTALPFENTPDPRFFYDSEQHREALAAIEYTIRMRKGFVLITGDVGSGKTTVGRTMIDRCGDRACIAQVLHGHDDGVSLLRQVLRTLELPIRKNDDHARMLERLRGRLVDQLAQNRPVVLLVDEAQTLTDEALEELRLMSNFDTAHEKLIQIVLIGQPELRDRLRSARLAPLRQRITLAKQLRPLSARDTAAYIVHRIRAASVDPEHLEVSFTEDAVREVFRFTTGIPRLINVACDNCLLLAFVRKAHEITPGMVRRSIEDMVPNLADPSWPQVETRPVSVPAMSLSGSY